ncbi:MAG: alpha-mannosidase [Clostridia bacterium]|nr:alpha-mannosidase [Clostridia bacterium]
MKKLHMISNAHLDPVWQWRWQEGCGEVMMTFRSALDRLKEYPELIFTCSSAAYYRWIEELDPSMFEEIRMRVKEGRWIPVNGWWVQPDCNMPSGESFARHALYSQLYYREKFGLTCRTGYNIDSFGHAGSLPQILKLGKMDSYVYMRPGINDSPHIPNNAFLWQGVDGTEVKAFHLPAEYGLNGSDVIEYELKRTEKNIMETDTECMYLFGVGNHGGGPTRGDIEYLLSRRKDAPHMTFSDPDKYFEELEKYRDRLPVYRGELAHHARGCYSTTSVIKQLNRKCENALTAAENWNTASRLAVGTKAEGEKLAEAWKDLLFCQFHDSLCGCSIADVFSDASEFIGGSLASAHKIENAAHISIISNIDTWVEGISDPVDAADQPREFRNHGCPYGVERPIVVFNPHPFEVTVPVHTLHPALSVRDSKGNFTSFQNIWGKSSTNELHIDTLFLAKLPPMGYETFHLRSGWNGDIENAAEKFPTKLTVTDTTLENQFIRAVIDSETGLISSLILKAENREIFKSFAFVPTVIDDSDGGSWGGPRDRFDKSPKAMKCIQVRVREKGPLRATIRAKFVFGLSSLTVDYSLSEGMNYLEANCKAIWQEDATMLKIAFPLKNHVEKTQAEMPYSFAERLCDGGEEPMHRWVNAGNLTVANDSKYGYDCDGKELRITAIRNNRYAFGKLADDRTEDDFDHTDEGIQRFALALMPHSGNSPTADSVKLGAVLNQMPISAIAGYHKGNLPQSMSFVSAESNENSVMISAFKFAEDGSDDIIVRAYEALGLKSQAVINVPSKNIGFETEFDPFEIKVFRIDRFGDAKTVDFLED